MQTTPTLPLLCAVLISLTVSTAGFDKGFELLFTSNRKEFRDLVVKFEKPLPTWLNGTVFHNGLGVFEQGNRKVSHFFDAFAKFNSLKLRGGSNEALFTNKFARTIYHNDSVQMNDIAPFLLFDNPTPKFEPEVVLTQLINGQDNVNVNLIRLGNDMVAVGDFPRIYRVDEPSLETIEKIDTMIPGVGISSNRWLSTSHPVPEAGTDNWFTLITEVSPFEAPRMHILRAKGAVKREHIKTIQFNMIPYMHSFAVTKKHIIIFNNPVTMDIAKMVETGSPKEALNFVENRPTYVHVVEIATGKVQILQTEAVFGMHYANAFMMSDSNVISVDAITFPDIEVIKTQMLEDLLHPVRRNAIPYHTVQLKRYLIDLDKKSVKVHQFPSNPDTEIANRFDLPVFNELYRFNKYCYIYGTAQKIDRVNLAKWALIKKDTCDHNGDKVWYKENHYPGEPWFEARPGSTKEDDGLVMAIILDGEKGKSYLAIFDAQSLEMVNKAYLPTYLPMTLHGRFLRDL